MNEWLSLLDYAYLKNSDNLKACLIQKEVWVSGLCIGTKEDPYQVSNSIRARKGQMASLDMVEVSEPALLSTAFVYVCPTRQVAKEVYNALLLEYRRQMDRIIARARAGYRAVDGDWFHEADICPAFFHMEWDGSFNIKCDCMVNRKTKQVFDIDRAQPYGVGPASREYIEFRDVPVREPVYPKSKYPNAGCYWYTDD